MPAKPPRADAQRNHDLLVEKAREIFEAGTFFELRFDDFATLAGVGTGTLYRHFPTREALAAAVYDHEIVTLCARARELQATLPAFDALGTFLRAMVDHMDANQGLARTLATFLATDASADPVDPADQVDLPDRGGDLEDAVGDLVAAAVADGSARNDVGAGAIMLALHGIGAAHDRRNWRAEVDDLITILLDGLRA